MLRIDYDFEASEIQIPTRNMPEGQPEVPVTSCCVEMVQTVEGRCCCSRKGWWCIVLAIAVLAVIGFICELRTWLAVDRARMEAKLMEHLVAGSSTTPFPSSSSSPSPSPLWDD